ncbi:MAG: UDP-N-acetylmuramate dehydrogenase [Patescibacteria group bacterium]|nr:MAG: UDP-N-acetylmuramate dehydrogenase [Patescibacteria group bacterium]
MAAPAHLAAAFGERLKENEPLAKHVHIRIGGPADLYLEAKSSDEIVQAVEAAIAEGLPFAIFGGGSNTLPSDDGFRGLVIQAANRNWSIDGTRVIAEAGVPSGFLARKTAEAGLTGLEWAVSLPGTIGGAVRGNAGCFGGETKDAFVSAETLLVTDGRAFRAICTKNECGFGYRESRFKRSRDVILSAEFALAVAPKETCLARLEEVLSKRKADQPSDAPSAGCMFKNFDFKDEAVLAKLKERVEVPEAFLRAKRLPAGWLIEQADMKGKAIGAAKVSEKHGNFLLNLGGATASDVLQLISLIKMRIRNEFGIQLEEEVQLLGF